MTEKDKSCMAVASPSDPCFFVASGTAREGQVNAVEPAKGRSRCYVCGEAGSKGIAVGELRFRYTVRSACGRFKNDKTTMHTACATALHLPSVEHLEQCRGFAELSPEQQQELRGLGCLQEGS